MQRFRLLLLVSLLSSSLVALARPVRAEPTDGEQRGTGRGVAPPGTSSPPSQPAPGAQSPQGGGGLRSPFTPEAALARATAFYEAGEYVQCAEAFADLLDDASKAASLASRSREQARVYRAACLIAQGKIDAADDQFRIAVRDNPQMAVPSAIVFPPAVIERFVVVRTGLLEEIRRAEEERARREREEALEARRRAAAERERVARLEKLAGQETIIIKNRRWLATVPFGIGQFQNRDYFLGSVFLASEVLLLGAAVAATSIELSLNSQANGGAGLVDPDEAAQLNQNLAAANRVAVISTAALLAVAAGGIVEAHLGFVPEFRDGVRQRTPERRRTPGASPGLSPVAEVSGSGALLGLTGRF